MSKNCDVNLKFRSASSSYNNYGQYIEVNNNKIELSFTIIKTQDKDENVKAHTKLMQKAWDLIINNIEDTRKHLAKGINNELIEMRKDTKNLNVPNDNEKDIFNKLNKSYPKFIMYFIDNKKKDLSVHFDIEFNNKIYEAFTRVQNNKLTSVGLFSRGDFRKAPKGKKLELKEAKTLYKHHLENLYDDDIYKYYIALSKKEIDKYIDLFIADKETDPGDKEILLLYLSLFSYKCGDKLPDKLFDYLIAEEIFYYAEYYCRASSQYAKELIALLEGVENPEAHDLAINHILCSLARMPSKEVGNFFIKNSKKPVPIWAKNLYIPTTKYAQIVGCWQPIKDEEPRMLYNEEITVFKRVERDKTSKLAPLKSIDAKCGFCGQPLTLIYNKGIPQATCINCSCYQSIYTKIEDKKVVWHPKNKKGEFLKNNPDFCKIGENPADSIEHGLVPTKEKRLPTYTANEFAIISHTQLGGMPTAINDLDVPICPDCGRPMIYVGQLDMGDLDDYEGIYYFFECPECKTTASNYGQS